MNARFASSQVSTYPNGDGDLSLAPPEMVWIVDPSPVRRRCLGRVIQAAGLQAEAVSSLAAFLESFSPPAEAGCVVAELRLADGTAMDLLGQLRGLGEHMPVIVHTMWGSVRAAVDAWHAGAADFLQAPSSPSEIVGAVQLALRGDRAARAEARRRARAAARIGILSRRERDVASHVIAGKTSKLIAAELGISTKTVEAHRGRLMHKLGVSSVPELMGVFGQASEIA
jgi:two-component system CheB/CheR fusion protein